jgi:hypothetical protein
MDIEFLTDFIDVSNRYNNTQPDSLRLCDLLLAQGYLPFSKGSHISVLHPEEENNMGRYLSDHESDRDCTYGPGRLEVVYYSKRLERRAPNRRDLEFQLWSLEESSGSVEIDSVGVDTKKSKFYKVVKLRMNAESSSEIVEVIGHTYIPAENSFIRLSLDNENSMRRHDAQQTAYALLQIK